MEGEEKKPKAFLARVCVLSRQRGHFHMFYFFANFMCQQNAIVGAGGVVVDVCKWENDCSVCNLINMQINNRDTIERIKKKLKL